MKARKTTEYQCPYCPALSKSASGRSAHIRGIHKDRWLEFLHIPTDLRKELKIPVKLHELLTKPSILEVDEAVGEGFDSPKEYTENLLQQGIAELERVEKEMVEDLKTYEELKQDLETVRSHLRVLRAALGSVERLVEEEKVMFPT